MDLNHSNGANRRIAERRSIANRRTADRAVAASRRSELRRQSDVLQVLGSPAPSLTLPKRSLGRWIEGGLN